MWFGAARGSDLILLFSMVVFNVFSLLYDLCRTVFIAFRFPFMMVFGFASMSIMSLFSFLSGIEQVCSRLLGV